MPNILDSAPIDIDKLLSRGKLQIPQYQRSYSWTKREISEFLEDLFGSIQHTESWFLGIIYTYNSADESTHARRVTSLLLDGQQRMTTLFILLKELTLYYEILPDLDVADAVRTYANSTLTSLIFETGTETPRITLDEANRSEFTQYLQGQTREESAFDFYSNGEFAKSHKLLNEGIEIVRGWLENDFRKSRGERDELENFKKLIRFILYNIEMIEIQLDTNASFYNIFENINDRGRRLTDSDKFKNRYCSLIPKSQIPQFETDWFQVSKSIFALKKDLDKDLFGFYFRSTGINDLEQGGFYRKLRNNVQSKHINERTEYVNKVWSQVKEMLRLIKAVEGFELVRLFQGNVGNNLLTDAKVVNVIVRDAWKSFDQYGVIAYALYLNLENRSNPDAFKGFLIDLLNAVRFYIAAFLLREGANAIRDYTIEIAKGLGAGKSLTDVLLEDGGRLDFASKFVAVPLDQLSIQNNNVSKLILLLLQAHINREIIEHYDPTQSWTLEHLMPKEWESHWPSAGSTDWSELNDSNASRVSRKLDRSDLDVGSKNWIQQLLGNKFVLSWKQNNEVRNDGFLLKKERSVTTPNGIVMPDLAGSNIADYSSFGVAEIIERTNILGTKLVEALRMRELPG